MKNAVSVPYSLVDFQLFLDYVLNKIGNQDQVHPRNLYSDILNVRNRQRVSIVFNTFRDSCVVLNMLDLSIRDIPIQGHRSGLCQPGILQFVGCMLEGTKDIGRRSGDCHGDIDIRKSNLMLETWLLSSVGTSHLYRNKETTTDTVYRPTTKWIETEKSFEDQYTNMTVKCSDLFEKMMLFSRRLSSSDNRTESGHLLKDQVDICHGCEKFEFAVI